MNNNNEQKYTFIWSNFAFAHIQELNMCLVRDQTDLEWNRYEKIFLVSHNNTIRAFHSNEDVQEDMNVRGKLLLDEKYRRWFLDEVDRQYDISLQYFDELEQAEYRSMNADQLLDLYYKHMKQWMVHAGLFHVLQHEGTYLFLEELKKYVPDLKELNFLMKSPELDLIEKEFIDWNNLLLNGSTNEQSVSEHAKKYPWLMAAHACPDEVTKTIQKKITSTVADKHLENNLYSKKDDLREKQNKILHSFPPDVVQMFKDAQRMSLARMIMKAGWSGVDYMMMDWRNEIGRRYNEIDRHLALYYMSCDYERLLQQGEGLSEEEKIARKKCRVAQWKDGKVIFLSGNKALEVSKMELGTLYKPDQVKEFSGTVAHKGKVSGVARILWSNDVQSAISLRSAIQGGDIVVTQMTQPNIVDILKKAGAIITDEGGLLSHAAVVAREFGIPCIVGTKVATQVLKDGDLIEVDADEGSVRIVERKK